MGPPQPEWQLARTEQKVQHSADMGTPELGRRVKKQWAHNQDRSTWHGAFGFTYAVTKRKRLTVA